MDILQGAKKPTQNKTEKKPKPLEQSKQQCPDHICRWASSHPVVLKQEKHNCKQRH